MGYFQITHKVNIHRFKVVAGKEAYDTTPTYSNIEAAIQPSGPDTMTIYPSIDAYQLFDIFIFDNLTIKTGDKLVSGSDSWIVRGVPQAMSTPYVSYLKIAGEKII